MSIINDIAALFGKVSKLQKEVKEIGTGGGPGGDSKLDSITLNGSPVPIIDKDAKLTISSTTVKLEKVNNTADKDKPISDPTLMYIKDLDLPDKEFVKNSTTESLNGYATQIWVGQQGFLKLAALSPYSTTVQVDAKIVSATNDMSTQTWVKNQNYLKSADVSNKVDKVKPTRLSHSTINVDGTLNASLPPFGNVIKVLGTDSTGAAIHSETVEEYVIDNTSTKLTLQDLVARNAEKIVCPNLMLMYNKMGNKWGYITITEVTE